MIGVGFHKKKGNEKVVNINFIKTGQESITIQCRCDVYISEMIEKYRNKANDRNENEIFIFNGINLVPDLTLSEMGISAHNGVDGITISIFTTNDIFTKNNLFQADDTDKKEDEQYFPEEDEINDHIFEGIEDYDEDEVNNSLINKNKREKENKKLEELSKKILGKINKNGKKEENKIPKTFEKKREILVKEMTAIGKLLNKSIIRKEKESPNNFISEEEATKDEESDFFPIGLLAISLKKRGIKTAIAKNGNKGDVSAACLQMIFNGMATRTKLELNFDLGEKENRELLTNKNKREKFHKKWKSIISQKYGIPENEIAIVNPRKDSLYKITVVFYTKDYTGKSESEFNEIFKESKELKKFHEGALIEGMLLDRSMFDSKGNNKDGGWAEKGEYRGPPGKRMEYFPPYGWVGYGLNVRGRYEDDNWLGFNNQKGEWWIAYQGLRVPTIDVGEFGEKKVAVKSIIKEGFITGKLHEFDDKGINRWSDHYGEKEWDLNHPNKLCKHGAYFTPFIYYAQFLAQLNGGGFTHRGKNYLLAFMCRINPETTQIRKLVKCEWICSGTVDEVRPYRILIKEDNDEISEEEFERMRKTQIGFKKD